MAIFSNSFTGSVAIPDNNLTGIINTLAISGVPTGAFLSQIRVNLNITHTFIGDLNIFLVDPDGNQIELSTRNGGTRENFVNAEFLDSASTLVTSLTSVTGQSATGLLRPEQALSTLYSGAINGNWSLKISDNAGVDLGNLTNWSIDLTFGEASAIYSISPTDVRPTVSASRTGDYSLAFNASTLNGDVFNTFFNPDGGPPTGYFTNFANAEYSGATTFLSNGNHALVFVRDVVGNLELNITLRSGANFGTNLGSYSLSLTGNQVSPMVAELSDGNLIVAYVDVLTNTLKGTIFNTTTNTFGSILSLTAGSSTLATSPNPALQQASLIALSGGGFAVGYQTSSNFGNVNFFNSTGGTFSSWSLTGTAGTFSNPALVQMADGNVMALHWDQTSFFVYRFNGAGASLNGVPSPTISGVPSNEFHNLRATALLDGRVMVVGSSIVEGGVAGSDIWGQVLNANGTLDGTAFRINGDNLIGTQSAPDIATLADGRVIVTWTDHIPGDSINMRQIIDIRSTGVNLTGYQSLNETWIGSRFADTLNGGLGNDSMDGGAGNDLIHFDAYDTAANIKGGADFDTLFVNNSFNFAPSGFNLAAQGFEQAQHDEIDIAGAFNWGTRTTFYANQWVKTKEIGTYDTGIDNADTYEFNWTGGVLTNFYFSNVGGNGKPYQNYTISYNPAGQQISVVGLYDNGNTYTTANDVANEAWSSVTTNFNPGGQVLFSNTSYDNGDNSVANYINGLLDSSTTYDTGTDDQFYQYYTVNYNGAGVAFAVSGINNDGSPFAYLV